MGQLNVEIPDWLAEALGRVSTELHGGKSGLKSRVVQAALLNFLFRPIKEQRRQISRLIVDHEEVRREVDARLAKRIGRKP